MCVNYPMWFFLVFKQWRFFGMGRYIDAVSSEIESIREGVASFRGDGEAEAPVMNAYAWSGVRRPHVELEPGNRDSHIRELEEIDDDVRRLVELEGYVHCILDEARRKVKDIALHFSTEYDKEKVVASANWWFRNVSKATDDRGLLPSESECAFDGIAYLAWCLRNALGEQQMFKMTDVRYDSGYEGMQIFFTIPESLGMWCLSLPFATEYKPSVHDYVGRYNERCPYPLQMSIKYMSPSSHDLVQTVMSAWTFNDMARKWFAFDMDAHRKKQYLPYKVEDGFVVERHFDPRLGEYESRSDVAESQWMDLLRRWHNEMIPEYSK